MARLEIEIAAIGADKVKSVTKDVNNGLASMQSALTAANSELSKANATSRELEAELVALNKQLSDGSISSQKFAKEQSEIFDALSSARTAAQGYQAQVTSINATLNKGVTSVDNYGNSVKKLAGYHSDFSRGIRGASGVSLEFSRIIQDIPYGIVGIGNNIQQLTANYTQYATNLRAAMAAQGQTISNFGIFKSAVSSLVTPMSLLTLGVSLATTAFTAYTLWSQKSAKADKDKAKEVISAKQALDEYTKSLNASIRTQIEGLTNSAKEITQLRLLYDASRNLDLPLKERIRAAKQLQDQYPKTFENFSAEQIALGKASKAYKQLSTDIIATARAAARTDVIAENEKEIVQLEQKRKALERQLKTQKEIDERAKKTAKETIITGGGIVGTTNATADLEKAATQQTASKKLQQDINNISKDITTKRHESLGIEKEITKELKDQQSVSSLIDDNKKNSKGRVSKTPIDKSAAIVTSSDFSADLAGLTGVDKDVEKVRQKYAKMYSDLDTNAKKSAEARKTYESDVLKIQANEATEITQIIIAEKNREAEAIQQINDESGVKAAESIQKDLLSIDKWYNARISRAQGNSNEIAAIENGKQLQINAVFDKYAQKRIDAEQKIFDKINSVTEQGFTDNLKHTVRGSQKIDEQLRDRISKLKAYFEELRRLNTGNPNELAGIAINIAENAQINAVTGQAKSAKNPKTDLDNLFDQDLKNAVSRFGDDFVNTLKNINREANETFGQVLGRLGTSLWESLGEATSGIFINQFKQQFSDAIKSASSDLSTGLKGAIAGAGLLGGAISGLTKKTSGVGQGIGGALSGAATGAGAAIGIGAALGTAAGPLGIGIGAAIGGLVGLFSGIFGAKKKRKEEAIQAAQLAEQVKQTKLLERQNALAYASSIIGQQTNQGIVTGIERDAKGNLVAVVTGKQIKFIYDQAAKDQKRGIM